MQCRLVAFLSVLIASRWFAANGVPRTYCNSQHRNIQSDWRLHCTVSGKGSCIPQFCPWKTRMPDFLDHFEDIFQTILSAFSILKCSCPTFGSNQQPRWGLAERPSLQRKLVVDAGFGGGGSSTIIEHDVARDVAAQRKRTCPEEVALEDFLFHFKCSCPIVGSNQQPRWGLAERPSLQRSSSTIIEHDVARDVAAQRKRTCPEEVALEDFLFHFKCSCPIVGSNQQPRWGLALRPSLQRSSSTIIEHGVARDVAQRKRTCPEEAALRTVLLDLGLKEAELTDIRDVKGVGWDKYLGSSDMIESKVV